MCLLNVNSLNSGLQAPWPHIIPMLYNEIELLRTLTIFPLDIEAGKTVCYT